MKEHRVFISGTDTGVGKTFVSTALTRGLCALGKDVQALKPIAAGCEWIDGAWRNDDALALQQAQGGRIAYDKVNPIALRAPMAPHLAAELEGKTLSVSDSLLAMQEALAMQAEWRLIEGAGGWLVPLNEQEDFADLALALTADVVLVVGMRLGCLNHALLTAQAIRARGARLLGWVANQCQVQEMSMAKRNLDYLCTHLQAPLLGEFGFGPATSLQEQTLARALLSIM